MCLWDVVQEFDYQSDGKWLHTKLSQETKLAQRGFFQSTLWGTNWKSELCDTCLLVVIFRLILISALRFV